MASSAAPTTEIGYERQPLPVKPRGLPAALDMSWAAFIDHEEYVPDLKWPKSVRSYQKMRTDAQRSGLYRAMTMPIRRFKYLVDPNGAAPDLVEALAADLNMDIKGQEHKPRGRQRDRFSWKKHMYEGLLALMFGHAYFEQLGVIGDDGMWHLRKLAPRPQDSIQQINVADDGGLISIKQRFTKPIGGNILGMGGGGGAVEIPVDRLIAYIWEQEGANWVGRSIFRDCYRNWLIKDRLMRIDAINHERAGGVPIVEGQPGASPRELDRMAKMAQQFKVGEDSGGSLPSGASIDIKKAGGGTDVVASIRYHDEAMARLFLHMFIQLGQTETGSRALGQAFIEYAFIAQKAVAQWFLDVTNEHMVEDWVDWNYGVKTEDVPLIIYEVQEEDERIAVQDLVLLAEAGLIQLDRDLENSLRDRFNLPERKDDGSIAPEPAPQPLAPVQTSVARRKRGMLSSLRARVFREHVDEMEELSLT